MLIKIVMLTAFFAVMVGVGIWCRKHSTNVNSFVLGGRSVGPWLTSFAYGTSYFSAVIFVGYAGQFGWAYGFSAVWIGIGNAFIGALLAWLVIGKRTRLMTLRLKSATMPDFFGSRYGSKKLKIAASVIIFIFLIPYTASLYNGLSRLFEMAFGIDYLWCVISMAILTGVYVILGGYMATAINDFIQGIIMLVGIVAVLGAVFNQNGGFSQAFNSLSQITSEAKPALSGAFVSFFGPDPLALLGVVLLTSFGTWGLPQMVGKFYSIKSEKSIAKGTIISTVFSIIVAGGCYMLGSFGRLYANVIEYAPSGKPVFDSIVVKMISGLPDILIGIVVVLVLSASMSTLSTLVLTSGSTLTLDIIVPASKKAISEKKKILIIRSFIVLFIAVSSLIAIVQAKSSVTFIAQLMGISWGALSGAFLAPFLYGLYWKKTTKAAVWASFASGVLIMTTNLFCNFTGNVFINKFFTSPINAGVLAMTAGVIIVPVVSLLTKKPDEKKVLEMFDCFKPGANPAEKTAGESSGAQIKIAK